ncbi:hypothetical protein V6U71_21630 [Sphingopyxis sp. J-6]|uniref:hypothetical protein n=1 Tax=Sphingopyxis sp. J-6 TaxID=3122054 RepID=UPI00398423A7
MRHWLALFPIDGRDADKAAAVISSMPRAVLIGYFAFAAIIIADVVIGLLVLGGDL